MEGTEIDIAASEKAAESSYRFFVIGSMVALIVTIFNYALMGLVLELELNKVGTVIYFVLQIAPYIVLAVLLLKYKKHAAVAVKRHMRVAFIYNLVILILTLQGALGDTSGGFAMILLIVMVPVFTVLHFLALVCSYLISREKDHRFLFGSLGAVFILNLTMLVIGFFAVLICVDLIRSLFG